MAEREPSQSSPTTEVFGQAAIGAAIAAFLMLIPAIWLVNVVLIPARPGSGLIGLLGVCLAVILITFGMFCSVGFLYFFGRYIVRRMTSVPCRNTPAST